MAVRALWFFIMALACCAVRALEDIKCNHTLLIATYPVTEEEEQATQTCDIWALAISLILFKITGLASFYLMRKHKQLHSLIASYEQRAPLNNDLRIADVERAPLSSARGREGLSSE